MIIEVANVMANVGARTTRMNGRPPSAEPTGTAEPPAGRPRPSIPRMLPAARAPRSPRDESENSFNRSINLQYVP